MAETLCNLVKNSGGGSVEYSASEHAIGKWIDGSTLYAKTIYMGSLPNAGNSQVAHGIADISKIHYLYGCAYSSTASTGGFVISIPRAQNSDVRFNVDVVIDGSNVEIHTSFDYSSYTGYVTIEYTK